MQDEIIKAEIELKPITVQEMCNRAPRPFPRQRQVSACRAPPDSPGGTRMSAKNLPRSPLNKAQRTAKLLGMRWSAPVGAGTDKVNTKTAGAAFKTI